jgi:HTH-type transcriptional regulator / antitoxin HigA
MKILRNINNNERFLDLSIAEMLNKYMDENNLNEYSLATLLSINRKTLKSILSGEDFKFSYGLRISALLNISDDNLIKGFVKQLENEDLNNINIIKKASYIIDNFDLQELKSSKIISNTTNYLVIEKEICSFLGIKDIIEYSSMPIKNPLFSKSNIRVRPSKEKKMQDFWIKTNLLSFTKIANPNHYDRDLLIEFLKRIKSFTTNLEDGFAQAQFVLYKIGITTIVQSYLSKTKAYGVSMLVNDKPCIVITDMGKQYYKLWLTLLHELYHILEDYEYLKTTSYHISDIENRDLFLSEESADAFAREIFVPNDKIEILNQIINNPIKVQNLATKLGIHKSMLYGIYLDNLNKNVQSKEFAKYRSELPKSSKAIKNIVFDTIGLKSVDEAVKQLKNNLNILTA